MDTITISLITVAAVAGISYGLNHLRNRYRIHKRIRDAEERAAGRIEQRAFADTVPFNDPYRSSIDFQLAMQVTELDSRFQCELDPEQARTISLIFDGFRPGVKHREKHMIGTTAQKRAGVPWSQSVFAPDHKLVGPEDEWLNTASGVR